MRSTELSPYENSTQKQILKRRSSNTAETTQHQISDWDPELFSILSQQPAQQMSKEDQFIEDLLSRPTAAMGSDDSAFSQFDDCMHNAEIVSSAPTSMTNGTNNNTQTLMAYYHPTATTLSLGSI
jgi:hypothetical protein